MVLEYMTYGVFARHINGLEGLVPVGPPPSVYYWWPEQLATIDDDFLRRIRQSNGKAVLVNSNIGRPPTDIRGLVEDAWKICKNAV
jgi:hypothetical protein